MLADETRASSDDASDEASELIGATEQASATPELPPLRVRGSLAARIVALVLLVVVGTGVSAMIIVEQVRGLRANFDLLTGVYVPFQTELSQAQMQSQQVAAFVAGFGNPEVQLDRGDLDNLQDAIDLRLSELAEARLPLTQAVQHPERIGGDESLAGVHELARLHAELEVLVQDKVEPSEVLADASRQAEITRRFRELQKKANEAVAVQRTTVAEAGRKAEQLAVLVTIAAACFSLLATLLVILTLRPLRRLAASVRRIGRGDWSERLPVRARPEQDDEVARLAREVNLMAEALEEREQRLLRGERLAAVGRMAAQITHEIRNPLSSVALNVELLEDEVTHFDTGGEARQLLARISAEVDRLTQITEAYLGFARRPKPQLAIVDLTSELTDLLDFLAQEHQRDRIRIVRELPSEPAWVRADAGQLRQAFMNLLRNAKEAVLEGEGERMAGSDVGDLLDELDRDDASEPDASEAAGDARGRPSIHVRLSVEQGRARVLIRDEGPGIRVPPEGIDRIFEAFVTSKAHGTGLGLPMVQQIAVDHGGAVKLVETGPGGTTFEFSLPACDSPAPSVSSPNSP